QQHPQQQQQQQHQHQHQRQQPPQGQQLPLRSNAQPVDSAYQPAYQANLRPAASSRASVTDKSDAELLGPSFDATTLFQDLSNTRSAPSPQSAAHSQAQNLIPSPQLSPFPQAQASPSGPPPQDHFVNDPRLASPKLQHAKSVAAIGRKMERITPPRTDAVASGARSPQQRYSDEGSSKSDSSGGKKKGLFSSLINGMSSSPRRPTISTPSNPMHVTHVSIDNETGQYMVCTTLPLPAKAAQQSRAEVFYSPASLWMPSLTLRRDCRKNGNEYCRKTASPRPR
ncbi:MAG: hypothetical protein INR71_05875, partial [Terriglobus roseus]|nr:hypothetical protein [Terriglobus roseus]